MIELWKPIPGYEGRYEASSFGRIRSLDRAVERRMRSGTIQQRVPGKEIKSFGAPYPQVSLCRGGAVARSYVHEVVAATFIGPRPPGMQVCHKDGNPMNAWASNLRYDTPTGNAADRHDHGTHAIGSSNPRATFSELQVARIKLALKTMSAKAVAVEIGAPRTTISGIKTGRTWAHVSAQTTQEIAP